MVDLVMSNPEILQSVDSTDGSSSDLNVCLTLTPIAGVTYTFIVSIGADTGVEPGGTI